MPKRSPALPTEDHVNKWLGGRLRFCRENAKRSQSDVGSALGVSFQQIQKYENGTTSISLNRLFDFASYINVSMVSLLEGLDRSSNGRASGFAEEGQAPMLDDEDIKVGAGAHSKQKAALLSAFNRIADQKSRRMVVSLAETLADNEIKSRVA